MATSRHRLPALRRWLAPPVLTNEEETQHAQTFHGVMWAVIAVVVGTHLLLVLEQPATGARRLSNMGAVVALVLALMHVSRRGRTRLASWLVILGLLAIASFRCLTTGGIGSPVTPALIPIILLAGLLLGTSGGIVTAAAGASVALGFVVLEVGGGLPAPEVTYTPVSRWLLLTIWLGVAVAVQQQVASTLRRLLHRAEAEIGERKTAEDARERLLAGAAGERSPLPRGRRGPDRVHRAMAARRHPHLRQQGPTPGTWADRPESSSAPACSR